MEFSVSTIGELKELMQRNQIPLGLGLVSVFCLVAAIYFLFMNFSQQSGPLIIEGESSPSGQQRMIVIDIAGAVQAPGVYHLDQGARVIDAINAAGGLSEEADQQLLQRTVNQAQRLLDGAKVLIPLKQTTATSYNNQTVNTEASHNITTGGIGNESISINFSSQQALESLPGVGPVTAGKIISGRPYSSLEELVSRKIIGKKTYETLQMQLSL